MLSPSLQRDVLLALAAEGMYRPAWSSVILAELEYEETAKLTRRGGSQRRRAPSRLPDPADARGLQRRGDHWLEGLEGPYGLPDPDDEHVVAAAVVASADAIVTLDTKDFPATLLPAGLGTLRPAEFAQDRSLDPLSGLHAIRTIASRTGKQ